MIPTILKTNQLRSGRYRKQLHKAGMLSTIQGFTGGELITGYWFTARYEKALEFHIWYAGESMQTVMGNANSGTAGHLTESILLPEG